MLPAAFWGGQSSIQHDYLQAMNLTLRNQFVKTHV